MTTTIHDRVAAPRAAAAFKAVTQTAEVRWAALATALFAVGGAAQLSGAAKAVWWALYLAAYVAGGWEPALAAGKALLHRTLDVDLLMIVAAIGAAAIGQVFDGALLIVIFATSGALEASAKARTADAVRELLDLAPERATRLEPGGGETEIDTAGLRVGDLIRIRPGERIGADAVVVDGVSEVDQASITGEPLPATKAVGDEVFAGTLNGTGALVARVRREAADSVIARIVVLVEQASATKARTQLFIEKVERRYSVGVVGGTIVLFTAFLLAGEDLRPTLLRAMTFMIVASPCAVVLATMPPLLSAIAVAGRNGVLVKSAVVMERLADTTLVAFDKTGTLTEGTPRVAELRTTGEFGADEMLRLAAGAEQPSEHPIAAAVVAAARERGITIPAARDFSSVPGRGVTARVDGHTVALEAAPDGSAVLIDGRPAGAITVIDRIRPAARDTVEALTRLTGRSPALLTGDNAGAAGRLAAEAGIGEVGAGLLPQDKVAYVRARQADGARVLLVGDGVNDAPALAAADLGVAMGRHGSDLALQSADAVLVRDDLTALPAVVALSRRARRVVVANLVIAATFITALVAWDLFGHLPLPLGVAGHEGSTVIVGLNGLRLLRSTTWKRASP